MPRQDLELISNALAEAVESSRFTARLQNGLNLRAAMYRALAQGENVEHYRMAWLSQSVLQVLEYAKGLCREFDAAHPDDMATIYDLGDVLRIASNQVQAKVSPEPAPVAEEPQTGDAPEVETTPS